MLNQHFENNYILKVLWNTYTANESRDHSFIIQGCFIPFIDHIPTPESNENKLVFRQTEIDGQTDMEVEIVTLRFSD